jgi:hypothetical protein
MQQVDVEEVLTNMQQAVGPAAELAQLDRRPAQAAEPGQQPAGAQGTGRRAALHRRHQRLGQHEHLAAQAGHEQAGAKRRQGAGRPAGLKIAGHAARLGKGTPRLLGEISTAAT